MADSARQTLRAKKELETKWFFPSSNVLARFGCISVFEQTDPNRSGLWLT